MRRIDAVDVERRVGLGVAARLRFLEHGRERGARPAHLRQNEVARAVDDPGNPFDPIRSQAFAQRLDDRNATRDGRLERDHHPGFLRRGKDLVAVRGEERLVGGDDMLAERDRLQHE